jgi:hypothetical protein
MTTIVYHRGELATDSRIIRHQDTIELEQSSWGEKVYTSPCGRLLLAKAGMGWTEAFMDGLVEHLIGELARKRENPGHKIVVHKDAMDWADSLLIVTSDGAHWVDKIRSRTVDDVDIVTMGTGAHFARAAVNIGKSVTEAVEIAIRHDKMSGGKIHHYKASDLKPLIEEKGDEHSPV